MNEHDNYCPQCSNLGAKLYDSVKDFYFGYPGLWNYYKCSNPDCGVVWPSPMPDEDTLAKAYGHYYTHDALSDGNAALLLKATLARWIHRGGNSIDSSWVMRMPLIGRFLEDSFISSGAIAPQSHGVILDVGCGSGDRLSLFKRVGWGTAIGVEPDTKAVIAGVAQGRDIKQGTASYD